MFKFLRFRRQNDRPATQRPRLVRRPLVEDLEGRQLQSGLTVANPAPVQGAHIGMVVPGGGGVGQHIGSAMAIPGGGGVGQHIG
jgi:hypothetical protein